MLLSLLILGGAIASFRIAQRIHDEIVKIVGGLMALGCFMVSLILAPWILKLMMVIVLVAVPTCLYRNVNHSVICPTLCSARGRCHTPASKCFGWMRSHLHHYHRRSNRSPLE
ncbi:MAG: hypothetical protein VKL39_21070 [Leptolyngbyaceae bacterium]|nr:hypothetical protein [Leptolyngbyaceae bacterium]